MAGKKNQTRAVAFGGVISAMAVGLMFLTGLVPFAGYTLPAAAGILLTVIVIEYGYKRALLCYAAVAVLSLLLVPDRESAVWFAGFFGYYPILKGKLERVKRRPLEWALKFAVFNAAALASYAAVIALLGAEQVLGELGSLGKWGPAVLLLLGNFAFVLFDIAVTRLIGMYYQVLKPRFFDRLGRF